ncbi:hypothetical protein NUW54_g10877 [Trametes sanguinea]|uniref:Uncharacterized protein n=1 Tax=Trametes sanguinea TaxID=158606 RepID=A0ACC1NRC7_9APHY|nr:hypothetical protein NUW54_g10877 [Trametes sanguinea]
MPELDILHGFEHLAVNLKKKWSEDHWVPLSARLVLFPRVFATGTKQKDYITCSVDTRECFDYREELEPADCGVSPNSFDAAKARGKPYAKYLKPLSQGELVVKARGKEIIFAAGYHAVRVHFGLEGTMVIMPTQAFNKMIQNDCPGSNKDPGKAAQMRSFIVPDELTVKGARNTDGRKQTMAVFAALVGQEDTLVMVDHNRLLRIHIMSLARPWDEQDLTPESEVSTPVLAVEAHLDIFNGYGQHTSHDLLHTLGLWPGMPASELCADEEMFIRFKSSLHTYAAQYTSTTYRRRCLSLPNRLSPLEYNYKSDDNYHKLYLKVFRKSVVRMTREEYNGFAKAGLFDSSHVIGEPYQFSEQDLIDVAYREVPVYQYVQSNKTKEPIYTVIVAKPPLHWKYSGDGVQKMIAPDARSAGFSTTIGPASFHMYKNNQYRWDIHTGKAGRPPRAVPLVNTLRQRASRGQSAAARAKDAQAIMEEDQDLKNMTETGMGDSQRPFKRRRISKLSVGATDRITRSDATASLWWQMPIRACRASTLAAKRTFLLLLFLQKPSGHARTSARSLRARSLSAKPLRAHSAHSPSARSLSRNPTRSLSAEPT